MTDQEIYLKACERYRKMNGGGHLIFMSDLVTFLEKEIDECRAKNEELKTAIDRKEKEIKINNDFAESVAEAVQEMTDRWATITDCFEQIRKAIAEPAQTFTEEKTSDGGEMTINYSTCYQDIIGILLNNDYFVCCHVNDNDTITIEYWRA